MKDKEQIAKYLKLAYEDLEHFEKTYQDDLPRVKHYITKAYKLATK